MEWFMIVIKKAHHCTQSLNSLTQFNPNNLFLQSLFIIPLCLSMLSLQSGLQKNNKF